MPYQKSKMGCNRASLAQHTAYHNTCVSEGLIFLNDERTVIDENNSKSHNVSTYIRMLQYIQIINTTTCNYNVQTNVQTSKLEHIGLQSKVNTPH